MKAVYKSVIVVDLCVRELQIVLSSHRDIMLEHSALSCLWHKLHMSLRRTRKVEGWYLSSLLHSGTHAFLAIFAGDQ